MRLLAPLAVSALALGTPAFASSPHVGADVPNAKNVTKIELHGAIDVKIHDGAPLRMQSEDAETMLAIATTVEGDTLVVRELPSSRGRNLGELEIFLPEVRGVAAYGSGDVAVVADHRQEVSIATVGSGDVRFKGPATRLKLGSSGSGDVAVELTSAAESVEVGTRGSGDVQFESGTTRELVIASTGSGDIDADDLTAEQAKLATSGSGDIEVTLGGGAASFAVAGSGDITWHGSAKVQRQVRSGSGEIHHDEI